MRRPLALLNVLTLAAAGLLAQNAVAAGLTTSRLQVQQPQQHDMRDLTTLPQTPHDTYTGEGDHADSPEPVQTPVPFETALQGSKKKTTRGGARVTRPSALSSSSSSSGSSSSSSSPMAGNVSRTDTRSTGQKIFDGIDLSYGVFFNGPSLGSSDAKTTYNPWANGTWPIYFYHTVDVQYHFDRYNLIGAEMSSKQDLASGVTPSGFFSPVTPETTFNDPQFWYTRKAVINHPYFTTDLQFNLWPGVTDATRNTGQYFSAAVDTTWNLKIPDRHWTVYFTTRVRPYIYDQLEPFDTFTHNEWLYLSAGYYVGYNLTSSWQVNLTGIFDSDLYSDSIQLWNRGDASDDRAQLELNYFLGRFARIGAYVQTVVTNLSLVSSLVGLDITINLLSAK